MRRRGLNLTEIPGHARGCLQSAHGTALVDTEVGGDIRVSQVKGGGLNQIPAKIGTNTEVIRDLVFETRAIFKYEDAHIQGSFPTATQVHRSGNRTEKRVAAKQRVGRAYCLALRVVRRIEEVESPFDLYE